MRRLFPILLAAMFLISPLVVFAASATTSGLVPCNGAAGKDAQGNELVECQACHVVQLGQNIINFFVMIAAFIAVIIFTYAGFKMLTAAGETGKVTQARAMFTNVVVGLVIVLAGWLIIDTVMKWAFQPNPNSAGDKGSPLYQKYENKFGPWNQINCVAPIQLTAPTQPPAGGVTPGGGTSPGNGTCTPIPTGSCSVGSLQGTFGSAATTASTICNAESGGNETSQSKVDILPNSGNKPFSIGLFQINLTANTLSCNGKNLNCPSAFNGKNKQATIINESLYNECVSAASDAQCNIQKAKALYDGRGSRWTDWTNTANSCGIST